MPKNKSKKKRKGSSNPYDHIEGRRIKVSDLNGTLDKIQSQVRESNVIIPVEINDKKSKMPDAFKWKPEERVDDNVLRDCFKKW